MACLPISTIRGFSDLLVYPTYCYYWFWGVIFFFLWLTISLILYNKEKELYFKPDMISILGVSSLVIVVLAVIGTFIVDASGIAMIQRDVLIGIIAASIPFLTLWGLKK